MACSNIEIRRAQATTAKSYELSISKLYLHHAWREPSLTHLTILTTSGHKRLGETVASNWTLHDGPDPKTNAVVARAQGSHILCGDWHNSFTLVFEVDWLKGSTLLVMGIGVYEGQWGIVGGTGYFTMAQGYINKGAVTSVDTGSMIEVDIYATFQTEKPFKGGLIKDDVPNPCVPGHQTTPPEIKPLQPYRDGPKGAPGGGMCKNEPKCEPYRLERIEIKHGACIRSIEFSYIGKDGNRYTDGPWGTTARGSWRCDQINFGPTEFVKEVSGTVGHAFSWTVVTSLKFVTNVRTYGPYGTENGTPFSLPEKKNGSIVGFFGSSGGLLDQIGVFVRPF
ncbi:hypothetical protein ACP70R_047303 [Stipagrostis hirtigluma subsp. patula]